jgi:hypothetical protein
MALTRNKLMSTHPQPAFSENRQPIKTKFVLFAHYRTGSTLLTQILNMHPDILCEGEILTHFIANRLDKKFLRLFLIAQRVRKLNAKTQRFKDAKRL